MLAARVEQKNGTYLNNIQRDRQSSPSLHPSPYLVPILAAIHTGLSETLLRHFSIRRHQSEVVLGVLVVVLRADDIPRPGFLLG